MMMFCTQVMMAMPPTQSNHRIRRTATSIITIHHLLLLLVLLPTARSFLLPLPSSSPPPLWSQKPSSSSSSSKTSGSVAPPADQVIEESRARLAPAFEDVDRRTKRNLQRVLTNFREHQVGNHLFNGVDGYGHGDMGRDTLEDIYASLFGAEAALVRVQIFSGTHAISCALYGVLRPGDVMLGISGRPYDTLEEVIGSRPPRGENDRSSAGAEEKGWRPLTGSLREWGVGYEQVDLCGDGSFDLPAIEAKLATNPNIRVIHIQRSCGYQWRPSIPVDQIGDVIAHIRRIQQPGREVVVFVDNCYGEFVEDKEPTHVGADIIAGSLIKNPGGTLAPTGGYVVGRRHYVQAAFKRLSAPGVEGGATLGQTRRLYQGLFLAPTIVGESLKGSMLLAEVFGGRYGLRCNPPPLEDKDVGGGDGDGDATGGQRRRKRTDIIQAIQLGDPDKVLAFCRQVQRLSPVGAFIRPTPGATPGYGDEVVFADGTFVDGSTLELSADGPLREPYIVYSQGCTHWTHWALVIEEALVEMGLATPSPPPTSPPPTL